MATLFLDLENGNDALDGTTFANRWKTVTSGATNARHAAGDTIRLMASPDQTLVGNATWTNLSKTVTLATAVTANISDCETAWTASANVTSTADTGTFKENTKSAKHVIAAAFTTGKAAYFATGTIDLSAYQQVSFWMQNNAAVAASTLSLRLCSDTTGDVTVHTVTVPEISNSNLWTPITVDLGSNMNSAIASVALYADLDPGTINIQLDNIIACKAASSADSLTLTSLIGKVWNLCWVASTTYATNDIRKPTQPNRNGFRYKVTAGGGGASGSSEPTWPQEVGVTVTDGALTWTCDDLEETWYCPQSINGVTVKIDNGTGTLGNAGRGYAGTTETVATYKREPIKLAISATHITQKSGTDASGITYSGGWDRTNMTAQSGETWVTGQNGANVTLFTLNQNYVTLFNINSVHATTGLLIGSGSVTVNSCHHNHHINYGVQIIGPAATVRTRGLICNNVTNYGLSDAYYGHWHGAERITLNNNLSHGGLGGSSGYAFRIKVTTGRMKNNGGYGFYQQVDGFPFEASNLITAGNVSGSIAAQAISLFNSTLGEGMPVPSTAFGSADRYHFSQKDNQTADNHVLTAEHGTIISATDQRHTASGISWKFRPTHIIRSSAYPLTLSVAKIAVAANALVTLSIWTRRDNTNIQGQLFVAGGQIAGVGADLTVACAPSINTWVQSSNLTFTPTEAGVVEVLFRCWDGVGTTNNMWIDDFSASQA